MKEPMRVIEGNGKPGEAFWVIRGASESQSGEAEVEFFGPISEFSWFGDEITPKLFKDELYAKGKEGPVTVKVDSPGGEVFAAAALRAILQDYPGKVTADIIGLCASAATTVVMGADVVKMRDTATFMIHDPSTIAWGTVDEMQKIIEILTRVKESILNGYESKTGMKRDELAQLMRDETWMTAQEAKKYGFVDEVISGQAAKKTPKNLRAVVVNCLSNYEHVPEAIKDKLIDELASELIEEYEKKGQVITDGEAARADEPADNETPDGEKHETNPEEAELRARIQTLLGKKES